MASLAIPKLIVLSLPEGEAGHTETAVLQLTNVGTVTGRWIIRGTIYDYLGNHIGNYISKSVELAPGQSATVSLTTNGKIASMFAGHYIVVKFVAAAGNSVSESGGTPDPEYRLHIAAISTTTPSGSGGGSKTGTPSSGLPPSSPPSSPPLPWYQRYLPELVGGGVALGAIVVGMILYEDERRGRGAA